MKKIFISLFTLSILTGCDDIPDYAYDEAQSDVVESYRTSHWDSIGSLVASYPITIQSVDGTKIEKERVTYLSVKDILEDCQLQLEEADLEKDKGTKWLRVPSYSLVNNDKINLLNICAKKFVLNETIPIDGVTYILSDDRIKDNLKYPYLNSAMVNALKDSKITYSETMDIYKNLDKALADNRNTEIEKVYSQVKDYQKTIISN